jgi:hypothetical protein
MRAQAGYMASKGIKPDGDSALTKGEIDELQAWMREEEDKA